MLMVVAARNQTDTTNQDSAITGQGRGTAEGGPGNGREGDQGPRTKSQEPLRRTNWGWQRVAVNHTRPGRLREPLRNHPAFRPKRVCRCQWSNVIRKGEPGRAWGECQKTRKRQRRGRWGGREKRRRKRRKTSKKIQKHSKWKTEQGTVSPKTKKITQEWKERSGYGKYLKG